MDELDTVEEAEAEELLVMLREGVPELEVLIEPEDEGMVEAECEPDDDFEKLKDTDAEGVAVYDGVELPDGVKLDEAVGVALRVVEPEAELLADNEPENV